MKKTLIALAVLGATTCIAQAQSSLTIYGQLQPSYDYVSVRSSSGTVKKSTMANNGSRIGFMGSEDLGGGLKAIFKLESKFDMVNDSGFSHAAADPSSGSARDTYVGLSGRLGTVQFGNIDSVYKSISASYDPFEDTLGDYNSIMGYWANDRYRQTINYYSPVYSGVQFQANYALLKAQSSTAFDTTAYSLGVVYNNGPLNLLAAYDHQNIMVNFDMKNWKIGAAYNFGQGTTVRGIYEKMKATASGASLGLSCWLIGAEHKIGATTLMANYISASDIRDISVTDTGATAYNLGVKYDLSKRTNVMAVYAYLKNDVNGGGIYRMGGDEESGYYGGDGAKTTGFSVRLQHKF